MKDFIFEELVMLALSATVYEIFGVEICMTLTFRMGYGQM